jgi:hypothetical protein
MPMLIRFSIAALIVFSVRIVDAQLVPGTGQVIENVGDDFEDEKWEFVHNYPKSTKDIDEQRRYPMGKSTNGRWYEGQKRGQPDYIKRIPTPAGGLEGSTSSLVLRSLYTGIARVPSYRTQQDDFIANVKALVGGSIHPSRGPSVVTRVYMPPFEDWEKRSGATFAFRLALDPVYPAPKKKWDDPDTYWPGLLVDFMRKEDGKAEQDTAFFRMRAHNNGRDYRGPEITQTGWWTMGMSVTADGRVHYYAHPGVEDLGPDDHIASHYPYGLRAKGFRTFFFNVLNGDDGRTWSTEWIVDDPMVYVAN